jgi:hypothetical protein
MPKVLRSQISTLWEASILDTHVRGASCAISGSRAGRQGNAEVSDTLAVAGCVDEAKPWPRGTSPGEIG